MDQATDRRQLLVSAAAGALLQQALTATPARAEEAVSLPSARSVDAAAVSPATRISQEAERGKFTKLITTLKGYGAWPQTFDSSLEAGVVQRLHMVATEELNTWPSKLTHNPRLVEPLLGEIATLLDRCLAYRREAADLQIQGIAGALARLQADTLVTIDKQLIGATATGYFAHLIALNYQNVADRFTQVQHLAEALQAEVQLAGNRKISEVEHHKLGLALGRLQFIYDLDRSRLACQDVPGNAFNFAQRFDRTRKLFESDLTSAYRRAIAAAFGLSQIFGYTDPRYTTRPWLPDPATSPVPDKGDFLDDFVIWTRDAMRAVSLIGENELEYIEQVYLKIGSSAQEVSLDPIFNRINKVRLRSVAASFILNRDALTVPEKAQATFRLVMTRKSGGGTPGGIGPETVIFVPSVRAYGPQNPDFVEAASLYNVDPRGTWVISLSAKGDTVGPTIFVERSAWIEGIVLYMRVVGVVDTSQSGDTSLTDVLLRN